jgi:hypothetical protein
MEFYSPFVDLNVITVIKSNEVQFTLTVKFRFDSIVVQIS